jgi:adenylate cyclase
VWGVVVAEVKTQNLLVVEDEVFNRQLIVRQLNQEGYENVEAVGDGREALDILRSKPIDLVLLDLELPVLDGFGVLQELKADMRLREIPVLMISGQDEQENVIKCIELGAQDFLRKPFDPVLLRARMNACLERKWLNDQRASYVEQIRQEKKRSEELLNVILPSLAASELKHNGSVAPRRYDNVAILFCDIVEFTKFCDANTPETVVNRLQLLFEKLEELTDTFAMEKIKTIGDEYMATAGLLRSNSEPLLSAVKCGLEFAKAAPEIAEDWKVRIGVNIGAVVAGIVGHQKYQYDVWGDAVNVAARMASVGQPGTVCMTHNVWMQIESECEGRSLGRVPVKGKGEVEVIECYGLR